MSDEERLDLRLGALLRDSTEAVDEPFVRRVERALEAERRVEAARSAGWIRFGLDAAASAAVLVAFLLLGRTSGHEGAGPFAPQLAAVLLIACWFAVELRPRARAV